MRCLDRFRRDETGALTVEFVLWVPIILGVLVIVIDAATIYVTHTEMWNVARDTARRMVTGAVLTETQAENHAVRMMNLRGSYNYDVEANYDVNSGAEVIIRFATADVSILGYISPLTILGRDMVARVIMRPDPNVPFGSGGGKGSGGQNNNKNKG